MAAASDVISNCPSLPLFNHPPTYLLLFFISTLPVCLHSTSFYPSLLFCHQPLALRMKWWCALREEERRSNPTPSLRISEAPSAAEHHRLMRRWKRIEGSGNASRKSCGASRRCTTDLLQSAWVTAAHCNSLSLLLARIVQLFIICYFCRFPPAQRCSFMKVFLSFLHFFTFDFSSFSPLEVFPSILLPVITLSFFQPSFLFLCFLTLIWSLALCSSGFTH